MGSAVLKPGVRYDMPPGFGASVAPDLEQGFDLHGSAVEFETTPEALEPLLPRWFRPTTRPVVSIGYRQMIGMAWMGGRNYQLLAVRCSAECEIGGRWVPNSFGLVIWESDCAPILAGRELMGSPKLYADIPPITVSGADHSFTAMEYESLLVRGTVADLRPVPEAEVARKREMQKQSLVYYWKYVPGLDGEPDADYPVAIKLETPFTQMWTGRGSLELGAPTLQEAPYSSHIVKRLAQLPRRSDVSASVWLAADCKLYRDQTRRLDR